MDGTNTIGVPYPKAVIKSVLIGLSAILYAILLITLAVAGATRIKSARAYLTCSILPEIFKTTSCPVANSMAYGWIISHAPSLIKHLTLISCLLSSLASLTASTAATLPVTQSTTSMKSAIFIY